jgi:hypothetical protein
MRGNTVKDYRPPLSSAPAHSILNAQAFHCTNSVETDSRKTFARVPRSRAKANAPINVASNRADNRSSPSRAALPALPALRGTAFARPAAAVSCIQDERAVSAIADASVWLECNGELIDVRSVDVLRLREATPGIELVEFVCPRCRTPHASLRFG